MTSPLKYLDAVRAPRLGRRPNRGFSLIEVLIALAVLAVGLVAMARFQGTVLQGGSLTKERTEAAMHAQSKLEELRSYSTKAVYDAIASNTTEPSIAGKSATFTRVWTVTTAANYKTVTVSVGWPDKNGNLPDWVVTTTADNKVMLTSIIAWSDPADAGKSNS